VARNHRELEDEVEKDSEDKITGTRQRGNIQVMQKARLWPARRGILPIPLCWRS
jgi:hypothetical protein